MGFYEKQESERIFQTGQSVRFKASFLDRIAPADSRRYAGRIGVIHGFRAGAKDPIVFFPADGRRKELKLFEVDSNRLELVETAI